MLSVDSNCKDYTRRPGPSSYQRRVSVGSIGKPTLHSLRDVYGILDSAEVKQTHKVRVGDNLLNEREDKLELIGGTFAILFPLDFTKEITCKFYRKFFRTFYRDFYNKIEGKFN